MQLRAQNGAVFQIFMATPWLDFEGAPHNLAQRPQLRLRACHPRRDRQPSFGNHRGACHIAATISGGGSITRTLPAEAAEHRVQKLAGALRHTDGVRE
eukprot:COSAG05_NODE_275_length_12406_cov_12.621841_2_plen_98_part_00